MWLANRDAAAIFTIIPYQDAPSPPMTPALLVQAERALQVVTRDGQRFSGGRAVLFALRHVSWHPRLMRFLFHWPFVWGVEAGYWIVARNRNRVNCFIRDQ